MNLHYFDNYFVNNVVYYFVKYFAHYFVNSLSNLDFLNSYYNYYFYIPYKDSFIMLYVNILLFSEIYHTYMSLYSVIFSSNITPL